MTTVDEPTCEADWLGRVELTVELLFVAVITSAFGSVSSTFTCAGTMAFTIVAFVVVEVFAFSTITFSVLAFAFGNPEGISTAGLVVFRHVAVLARR